MQQTMQNRVLESSAETRDGRIFLSALAELRIECRSNGVGALFLEDRLNHT
jgi:hypothetical protein